MYKSRKQLRKCTNSNNRYKGDVATTLLPLDPIILTQAKIKKAWNALHACVLIGATNRTRTCDPLITNYMVTLSAAGIYCLSKAHFNAVYKHFALLIIQCFCRYFALFWGAVATTLLPIKFDIETIAKQIKISAGFYTCAVSSNCYV